MHDFSELVQYTTAFTLNALGSAQRGVIEELESSSATPLIKALQMVQLQKSHLRGWNVFDVRCHTSGRIAVR